MIFKQSEFKVVGKNYLQEAEEGKGCTFTLRNQMLQKTRKLPWFLPGLRNAQTWKSPEQRLHGTQYKTTAFSPLVFL